jgi:uncharacterized RDD family membrane protein YckC
MHDNDPYRSPSSSLESAEIPSEELVLADRGTRLGAVLLDALLGIMITLPLVLVGLFASGMFSGQPKPWLLDALRGGGMSYVLQIGMGVLGFLMFLALQGYPLSRYGQTWAKRWLGIRIVDLQGRKPEFVRMVLLRYGVLQVASVVPCLGPLFGLTDALFIFREDQRCVHDLMAGTMVVRGSPDA